MFTREKAHQTLADQDMDPADSNESGNGISNDPPEDALQSSEIAPELAKKSVWSKAKESLSGASSHVSKAAKVSGAAAAKTAALGKQSLEVASDARRSAVEAGKRAYSGSKLESAINYVDGELDDRGAKRAIKDTAEAVVGKLDQVTGKRLVELLEAKLRIQAEYNDILATRLAEVLDRIGKLEARFDANR